MKKPNIIPVMLILGLPLLNRTASFAYTIGAQVRELYTSTTNNDYASEAASKLKMLIADSAVESMTLNFRLGTMSSTDSTLFHPALRSNRTAIEIMTSRIHHGNGLSVFKPMIYKNPQLGTPSSIPEMTPDSAQMLLSSYDHVLSVYRSTGALRSISEFVLGASMGKTLGADNAEQWKAIFSRFRTSMNSSTLLSLELSSEAGLLELEKFKAKAPELFKDTYSAVDKIRFTLPILEYMDPKTLTIKRDRLKSLFRDRLLRVKATLPDRKYDLANIFMPGCFDFTAEESEMECPWHYRMNDASMKAQTEAMQSFFDILDEVDRETGNILNSVELNVGNTQLEPLPPDADPRFFIYNAPATKIIREKSLRENHHSSRISSPSVSKLLKAEQEVPASKLACIYFDEKDSQDKIGAIHARMLETIVGAFPAWERERRSITGYQANDLRSCDVVFYLASHFTMEPSSIFLTDLARYSQEHTVTWFNYKFDRFVKNYNQHYSALGFDVPYMLQPDQPPVRALPDPGFFRYFDYKGETFEKIPKFDIKTNNYTNSPEVAYVQIKDENKVKVLSYARHSSNGTKTPYVVEEHLGKSGSLFYFGDLPFSFIHYEDRYLIFCDVIYDILKEPTPKHPPIALMRMEDANPAIPLEFMTRAIDYLSDRGIPFAMATIPYYSNLFHDPTNGSTNAIWKPADEYPEFVGMVKYAKARGVNFVFHGVAHQAGDLISGFDGSTASDFEFWRWPADLPVPQDNPAWLVKKLELGEAIFNRLGIKPIAWESPHYAASVMDYVLFGKLFEWNYHQSLTAKSNIENDVKLENKHRFFECVTRECRDERLNIAKDLKVTADYATFASQFVPYPVYRDSYGQALIPETIGMMDFAIYSPTTWRTVTKAEDLIRRAKKLKVIRGAYASFFWHPTLMDSQLIYYKEVPGSYDAIGGQKSLSKIVDGLIELGYEFRSIADCDLFPRKDCKNETQNNKETTL